VNCSPGERSDTRDTGPAWRCAYAGYNIFERFSRSQDEGLFQGEILPLMVRRREAPCRTMRPERCAWEKQPHVSRRVHRIPRLTFLTTANGLHASRMAAVNVRRLGANCNSLYTSCSPRSRSTSLCRYDFFERALLPRSIPASPGGSRFQLPCTSLLPHKSPGRARALQDCQLSRAVATRHRCAVRASGFGTVHLISNRRHSGAPRERRARNLEIGLHSLQQHRDSGFVRLWRTPRNDVFVASRRPGTTVKQGTPSRL
jgi:hypothetical protein